MYNIYPINPFMLSKYFQDSVRIACSKCKRYGQKAFCPPFIHSVNNYKTIISSFNYGELLIKKYEIDDIKNWEQLGINSSEELRKTLIDFEEYQCHELGRHTLVLGAGSCKACEKCVIPCNRPDKAIVSIEGTGINVIRLVKDVTGIQLKFPVEKQGYFYRVGLALWQV